MKKPRPTFHHAKLKNSPRLQKVLKLLKGGAWHSTWDIIRATGVTCASTTISELRHNGYAIESRQEGHIWYFRLTRKKSVV